ncbi:hypothetical protein WAI453_012563 [Rhynchosporium graminicola]
MLTVCKSVLLATRSNCGNVLKLNLLPAPERGQHSHNGGDVQWIIRSEDPTAQATGIVHRLSDWKNVLGAPGEILGATLLRWGLETSGRSKKPGSDLHP